MSNPTSQLGSLPVTPRKSVTVQPTEMCIRDSGKIDLGIELTDEQLKNFKQIHIVACGTAMHAGIVGKYLIEKLARTPVNVDVASEFRYRDPILDKDDLVVIISQSGETADTLAAMRLAKQRGAHTLAVVNVVGSSIAREADSVLYTWAGLAGDGGARCV